MRFRDSPLGERFALWRARLSAWRERVTGPGLAVRALMLLSGQAAILLAMPESLRWRLGVGLALTLPLVALARPGGVWVWAVLFTALAAWTLGTLTQQRPSLPLAFGVGATMYLHHACAALAAAWRADASVGAGVLRGWAWRLTGVLAVSTLAVMVTAVTVTRPAPLPPEALFVLGTLGALAIPVAIVANLSRR